MTKKIICYTGGFIFLGLGFVGILLPLLPTTIFWILAAWLFAKSHPAMQRKIYAWPKVGPVVEAFVEQGTMSRNTKRTAIFGITIVGGLSLYLSSLPTIFLLITLLILMCVVLFIVYRPEGS